MEILIPILLQIAFVVILIRGGQRDFYREKNRGLLVQTASSWISKRIGLLNHSSLAENSALLLKNCRSVHTIGMAFPIDIVFLDRDFVVLKTEVAVPPGVQKLRGPEGTRHVMELSAHSEMIADGVKIDLIPVQLPRNRSTVVVKESA